MHCETHERLSEGETWREAYRRISKFLNPIKSFLKYFCNRSYCESFLFFVRAVALRLIAIRLGESISSTSVSTSLSVAVSPSVIDGVRVVSVSASTLPCEENELE
jgi:hypothetical protein